MIDRRITAGIKRYIKSRDKYLCQYCGIGERELHLLGRHWHIDHRIPKLATGTEKVLDLNELVLSCSHCNLEKGSEVWELHCKVAKPEPVEPAPRVAKKKALGDWADYQQSIGFVVVQQNECQ